MLNDFIKSIIVAKNLSPSHFADEIGVQRSSISHILSGRNKPSLDIVQKIIRRFPELGTDWLLEEGTSPSQPETVTRKERGSTNPVPATYSAAPEEAVPAANNNDAESPVAGEKQIIRVMIFYADGTFSEFAPADK